MNENQRIQQVLSGNTSAFAYFVETYQVMAITIAYRICGNIQDAEDVVQESYVKAFRNLRSFRSDSKFSTWLYRIVYNTSITHTKTQMWIGVREAGIEDASHLADNTLEMNMDEKERKEIVADVMQKMPKGDALLLTLYYMEDNPVKEIAKITGLNEPNVKVKLFRARKLFKEMVVSSYGMQVTGS
ncbi:RNA polymerase sigma factor [Proteiniphilum sp. UBA5431]|uniref:RNA polymerase sigma factor n=1 Tax=Proteiniphilum sp. UBA5431 TaxID=1947280 RepID=UPI00257F18DC|nr:sigma-70 family RNA polymerase sigma factor [Proteiniphilum sp. UBA5431]